MSLIHANFEIVLLIIFTFWLVIKDRAFSKRSRWGFCAVLILCFLLVDASYVVMYFAEKKLENASAIQDNIAFVVGGISILTCVHYFYMVTKTYKRDRLTGLMVRHNLSYEMEDNIKKSYDIVLIDVDNFKLINDKYGHDKGDEALVTIVKTTLKNLPKGCRMYRFGGDEFVIISNKVSTEILEKALKKVNEDLMQDDYRVSYGIVRHNPNDDSAQALAMADKAMYENKRLLKSEDIWDDMTGLYNMRGFIDELDSFRKTINKENHIVCLVGVDVERLSNINKAYGYGEGNLIITVLAKCLKGCLRGRDFIGHLGSDEFVVAIECENQDDLYITTYINHLNELMSTAYEIGEKDYSVKLNIDISFIEMSDQGASVGYVDSLLYTKQENKDNRRKNDTIDADKEYNTEEEKLVLDILDNNKLQYAFQPIVSAKDGSILAYESLMRPSTETMISTLKILSYASRNRRSYDIERYSFFNTLEKFFGDTKIPEDVRIFINSIPGFFLNDIDFGQLKSKYGDKLSRMVVEITEQREMDDESLAMLNTRREKEGFNLAIDDYGSGCSNTNNLLRYMPQIVKLDRLLITGIDRNAKKQFFVSSVISFAKENDMLILAEGVETERELKTVIKLGVDMIQGYIISKPAIEVVRDIPGNIRDIIISENLKAGNGHGMTYTAGSDCELSVVSLAMEDYSRVNVSTEHITISGNSDYSADLTIKIRDNTNCMMTLVDVCLNTTDDRPCLELGKNVDLKLNIEGTCKFNTAGIYVPESSTITIVGSGVLGIAVKGHECYAIGADSKSAFGNIIMNSSGLMKLEIDGESCVGIGGGMTGSNSAISILSGTIDMTVAGVEAIGIGTHSGDVPINIVDSELITDFRVSTGAVIGTLDGRQNIHIENYKLDMSGSGKNIAVCGCPSNATGLIEFNAGALKMSFNGHNVFFMGGEQGDVQVDATHSNISISGEGDNLVGFGTLNEEAKVSIRECAVEIMINASKPIGIGAAKRFVQYLGPAKLLAINGHNHDIEEYYA